MTFIAFLDSVNVVSINLQVMIKAARVFGSLTYWKIDTSISIGNIENNPPFSVPVILVLLTK